jgi:OOP family OmpA-OmpF porin
LSAALRAALRFPARGLLLVLGACANPGTNAPGTPATPAPIALPVTAKFDPQPIAAPEHLPEPLVTRCDFTRNLPGDELFPGPQRIELSGDGTIRLAREVMIPLAGCANLELITVTGHTDRLGPAQTRQTLSERRAEAVKAFLVAHGIPSARINALGAGSGKPVATGCETASRHRELVDCLRPDRRVTIEVKGTAR